ncbi:MAG TPA: hypothetical protein DGB85_06905 [Deltaproteobacteria bacterium]|nr:hypothetical protein [Deltaproteobacteria bacterium]|tara:strand:+ start:1332 stop:2522 length:1191 start_codon:yes stop_codon:yes gene_type:complete
MSRNHDNFADLITFTRASTATFVGSNGLIQSATTNIPRIDFDPVTNDRKGLLIEESRTNLFTYSEDFSDSDWTKFGSATVTASTVTTPDGGQSGFVLETSSTNRLEDTPSTAITGTATLSIFGKHNNVSFIVLQIIDSSANGQRQWFKIDDGTLGSSTAVGTGKNLSNASITDMGSGFYRLSMSVDGFSSQTGRCLIYLARTDSSFDASSGDAAIIYGAQLEQGSFPTSYIPTSGAAATRAADIATIATSAFGYNQDEGTFLAEASTFDGEGSSKIVFLASSSGAQSTDRFLLFFSSSEALKFEIETGNVQQANIVRGTGFLNSFKKMAAAYQENNAAFAITDLAASTDTSCTIPANTILTLGRFTGTNLSLNGHMKKFQYFPRRLSDTQLQEITR